VVAPGARMTTLATLRQPPRRPTPATFVALAERLQTIRAIGLNPAVGSCIVPAAWTTYASFVLSMRLPGNA